MTTSLLQYLLPSLFKYDAVTLLAYDEEGYPIDDEEWEEEEFTDDLEEEEEDPYEFSDDNEEDEPEWE